MQYKQRQAHFVFTDGKKKSRNKFFYPSCNYIIVIFLIFYKIKVCEQRCIYLIILKYPCTEHPIHG